MTTRRAFLATSTAVLLVPSPAFASVPFGYVRLTHIGSGKAATGNATQHGRDEDPVDDSWFEPVEFDFTPKRDVEEGARSEGKPNYDRVRMVVPKSPGTKQLMTWFENKADVRCEVFLFNAKDTCEFGADSTGRVTKATKVEGEPLVELHYAYHSVSCEDLIRSKAAQWSWATRTQ